jgi:hypothetical protein
MLIRCFLANSAKACWQVGHQDSHTSDCSDPYGSQGAGLFSPFLSKISATMAVFVMRALCSDAHFFIAAGGRSALRSGRQQVSVMP